jgi:hypothetical protein
VPHGRDELIAYGPLLSDDGATWRSWTDSARVAAPQQPQYVDRFVGSASARCEVDARRPSLAGEHAQPDG